MDERSTLNAIFLPHVVLIYFISRGVFQNMFISPPRSLSLSPSLSLSFFPVVCRVMEAAWGGGGKDRSGYLALLSLLKIH